MLSKDPHFISDISSPVTTSAQATRCDMHVHCCRRGGLRFAHPPYALLSESLTGYIKKAILARSGRHPLLEKSLSFFQN
ncbi:MULTISPECIES: hypothetical protein [unclassified Bradyrhizobium]|uniref:hypothetical protein n=1 Tax=unclassified Bradyrhizobium TaxID=2631580 RepID=UPI0028F16D04|nr:MULTISPECIES: hypothetical protein [unclassified Bradyrhizobium]